MMQEVKAGKKCDEDKPFKASYEWAYAFVGKR